MDQFDPDSLYDDGARGLAGFDIDDVAPNAAEFDVDPVYRNLEVLPPTIAEIGGPTLGAESLWDEHSELLPFGAPTWTPAGALGAAGASPPITTFYSAPHRPCWQCGMVRSLSQASSRLPCRRS